MSDNDAPDDRRTEGVRIIGAQEAAEAAGRPDVVRRRRGSEKRYGDRPDAPEPAADLPRITISTTQGDAGDHRTGPPAAQPSGEHDEDEPRWSDAVPGAYDDPERAGFGHARLLEPEPAAPPEVDTGWSPETDAGAVAAVDAVAAGTPDAAGTPTVSAPEWDDPYEPPTWDRDVDADPSGFAGPDADPAEAASADEEFSTAFDVAADDDADSGGLGDDDSFVLPHWTEPPTGQVPKVVIGDNAPEPESLATYGSQPRWREEGDHGGLADFDDLLDDAPALGALDESSVEDDFFASDGYSDDFLDDDLAEYDDDGEFDEDGEPVAPRRRAGGGGSRADGPAGGGGGDRPLGVAIAVGVGLVAIGLLCFWLGALTTTLLATAVVGVAGFEYFTAVRERGNNPATLLGMVSIVGLMLAAAFAGLAAYPVVIALTVLFGLLWYLWVAPGDRSVQNLGFTLLGVLWIGFLGSFATLFLGLGSALEASSPKITSNPGIGVLIAAVVVAVSHDVGAYFIGKYVGRTPLSAASPNKTQEGLVGGVVAAVFVTTLVVGVGGISPIGDGLARTFVFALLCALVAPLGDLCESFIKRDLGIKDMGSVLPGHGGVLDRFDALLFVLPVAYFVTVLFDVWGSVG
jgi:phosphatidate cytidylyltransferase